MQICRSIDDYLRTHAEALYTVYAIEDVFNDDRNDQRNDDDVEIGLEAGVNYEDFASSYQELIPRERGFVRRIWSAARRG